MGRKPALDSIKRAQVCALIAQGCSRRTAAGYVGCATSTIRHTAMHDRQFRESLRKAELRAEMIPLKQMRTHALKSWRAAAWLLERIYPGQYARRGPGDLNTAAVREAISSLGRDIAAEIPDGAVRKRLEGKIRRWEEWVEKERRADADPLHDGKRWRGRQAAARQAAKLMPRAKDTEN